MTDKRNPASKIIRLPDFGPWVAGSVFFAVGFGLLLAAWHSRAGPFDLWQGVREENHPAVIHDARNLVLIFGIAFVAALSLAVAKIISESAGRRKLQMEAAERLHIEIQLRESKQRMQLVLQGADLGSWDWNVQTGEVIFNDRLLQMLGYNREEFPPTVDSWKDSVHPNDWAYVEAALEPHLAGHTESYETEHRVQHKSGEWLWILDKGRVIERGAEGQPLRMCGTHLDITKRKTAELKLQQYENIVASTTDMLALFNDSYVCLGANPAYLQAFTNSADEVIGHHANKLFGDSFFRKHVNTPPAKSRWLRVTARSRIDRPSGR